VSGTPYAGGYQTPAVRERQQHQSRPTWWTPHPRCRLEAAHAPRRHATSQNHDPPQASPRLACAPARSWHADPVSRRPPCLVTSLPPRPRPRSPAPETPPWRPDRPTSQVFDHRVAGVLGRPQHVGPHAHGSADSARCSSSRPSVPSRSTSSDRPSLTPTTPSATALGTTPQTASEPTPLAALPWQDRLDLRRPQGRPDRPRRPAARQDRRQVQRPRLRRPGPEPRRLPPRAGAQRRPPHPLHPRPVLQDAALQIFRNREVPYAAAVILDVQDNSVLAMAGHSTMDPQVDPLEIVTTAWAPRRLHLQARHRRRPAQEQVGQQQDEGLLQRRTPRHHRRAPPRRRRPRRALRRPRRRHRPQPQRRRRQAGPQAHERRRPPRHRQDLQVRERHPLRVPRRAQPGPHPRRRQGARPRRRRLLARRHEPAARRPARQRVRPRRHLPAPARARPGPRPRRRRPHPRPSPAASASSPKTSPSRSAR
jgi:hypothetical protein